MPPKMRPPNIATLTGVRSGKEQKMVSVLKRVEKRCKAALQFVSSTEPEVSAGHRTRSKGPKNLYKLLVHDCLECNMRNIEAFVDEIQQLGQQGTLLCKDGKTIQKISPADPNESPRYPAIEIPALSGVGRAVGGAVGGARGPGSSTSVTSSITLDKLESVKADLNTAFQELEAAHVQLSQAVGEVEAGQLNGYDEPYSFCIHIRVF